MRSKRRPAPHWPTETRRSDAPPRTPKGAGAFGVGGTFDQETLTWTYDDAKIEADVEREIREAIAGGVAVHGHGSVARAILDVCPMELGERGDAFDRVWAKLAPAIECERVDGTAGRIALRDDKQREVERDLADQRSLLTDAPTCSGAAPATAGHLEPKGPSIVDQLEDGPIDDEASWGAYLARGYRAGLPT